VASTAGATFIPGRCEPQDCVGGVAGETGGHGNVLVAFGRALNVPGQLLEFGPGAWGTSVAYVTTLVASVDVTFASHAP
jgi:hypothetical protein